MDSILLVGTSHVSKESVEEIKRQFLSFKPQIIAVELDRQRYAGLLQGGKSSIGLSAIRVYGLGGFLFLLIGRFIQQKIGKLVGMKPGSEMMYASELARNNNIVLALIDKPIDKTVKRLFKQLTAKEKFRFVGDILTAFWPFGKKKKIKVDLRKVPAEKIIEDLMGQLQQRYPTVYRVLLDERNHYMARQLVVISKKHPGANIMAVIGAGHKKGIAELLPEYFQKIEIVNVPNETKG